MKYDIDIEPKFQPLQLIDASQIAGEINHPWFNRSLCRVNDCVVRLGVFQPGEFHWHKHDAEDEFFFVLSGKFKVEWEGREEILQPQQGITVPKGTLHRTAALEPAIILMVEGASVQPVGD